MLQRPGCRGGVSGVVTALPSRTCGERRRQRRWWGSPRAVPGRSGGGTGRADLPDDHDHRAEHRARQPGLPTTCQDLIDGKRLNATLGLPLSVVVRTVLGQPSPAVGLTGRITCSYGIPSPSGGYALQVSATSSRDDAAAAARVPVNVEALRTPGVNPIPIAVGQTTGMYLVLPDGPMLLASAGTYSLTLTLGPTSFRPDQAPARAAAVADIVLTHVRA